MANRRLTIRKIKEILRLRYEAGRPIRQISSSAGISVGSIQKLLEKAAQAQLSWSLPEEMGDAALSQLLYPGSCVDVQGELPLPDWNKIYQELKRKDITIQLLWEEYGAQHPGRSYSYPRFCSLNRNWKARQKHSMRQTHQAGHKCLVDYCGCTVAVHDSQTGKVRQARVFFGVLGASNYTSAAASWGADAARLAGKPYPDGQFLWWLQRDHGLRQSQSGREQSLPLRSATESKLSAVGGALWRCSTAGASSPSSG